MKNNSFFYIYMHDGRGWRFIWTETGWHMYNPVILFGKKPYIRYETLEEVQEVISKMSRSFFYPVIGFSNCDLCISNTQLMGASYEKNA